MARFDGKVALVTGAASGIGEAIGPGIAAPCLFLASDDASYVNGTGLVVDGGWEISNYPDLRPILGG